LAIAPAGTVPKCSVSVSGCGSGGAKRVGRQQERQEESAESQSDSHSQESGVRSPGVRQPGTRHAATGGAAAECGRLRNFLRNAARQPGCRFRQLVSASVRDPCGKRESGNPGNHSPALARHRPGAGGRSRPGPAAAMQRCPGCPGEEDSKISSGPLSAGARPPGQQQQPIPIQQPTTQWQSRRPQPQTSQIVPHSECQTDCSD
jgi:hypothetical protein